MSDYYPLGTHVPPHVDPASGLAYIGDDSFGISAPGASGTSFDFGTQ